MTPTWPLSLDIGWHLLDPPNEPERPYFFDGKAFTIGTAQVTLEDLGKIPNWVYRGRLYSETDLQYVQTESALFIVGSFAGIRAPSGRPQAFQEGAAWAKARCTFLGSRVLGDLTS